MALEALKLYMKNRPCKYYGITEKIIYTKMKRKRFTASVNIHNACKMRGGAVVLQRLYSKITDHKGGDVTITIRFTGHKSYTWWQTTKNAGWKCTC